MKLHILSDLHLEFERIDPPRTDADVVVLAGDIHTGLRGLDWALEYFPDKPVVYVPGNHEYYGNKMPRLLEKMRLKAENTNVRILDNDAILIDNVQFLGCTLWSDFMLFGKEGFSLLEAQSRMNDYSRIRFGPNYRKLRAKDTQTLHMQSIRWLKAVINECMARTKVIITHHAPSMRSMPDKYALDPLTPAFVSNLDSLMKESGAELWIHGHTHESCDYRLGSTRVLSNPRGYPDCQNRSFDGVLVVEV